MNHIIRTELEYIRDVFVMYDEGIYYMYYSWIGPRMESGIASWICRTATSLDGTWSAPIVLMKCSDLSEVYGIRAFKNGYNWAPEVHKYKGKYYMFTTYWCDIEEHDSPYEEYNGKMRMIGHRASIIMRSDSPLGPFEPISRDANGVLGHSTPACWDTLDATLHVDEEGQPWMIFSRDWTTTPGKGGAFCAAKLSEDFSRLISEPIVLFKPSQLQNDTWRCGGVTDGAWLHRGENGQLYMLWSSVRIDTEPYRYMVALSRSETGKVEGPWVFEKELLFDADMYGGLDGGHASLLTDQNGQLWMTLHTPNPEPESPTFIPLIEKDDKLVWGKRINKENSL